VGSSAVQIARERGARVIGTASPNNHDYLRSLGAEPTAYGEGLAERVRELAPDGVDAALDAAGGGALPALVEVTGSRERVVTIADYTGSGRFSLPVAQTFPLAQIAEAHRLSETGHVRGKLILVLA
jgi:NADPH:quinone reductase-like Zn-dependent oxidoreductase